MRRYSIEPGTRNMYMYVYIRICTFVICEKYGKNVLDTATKIGLDIAEIGSKKVTHKKMKQQENC